MTNIDFKEFILSKENILFVVGKKGSGRSSLASKIKEDYLSLFPFINNKINQYLYIYQYGALIFNEYTLEDIYESSLKREHSIPVLVFFDLYDEMNEYEAKLFFNHFHFPSIGERYKLIFTISEKDYEIIKQDKRNYQTIYLEDVDILNELSNKGIEIIEEDINKSLLNHLYTYNKFSKEEIDFINASIIFGHGLISEYSFRMLGKDHYMILEYLRYHDIIYAFSEDEDTPYYQRFIYFKHYSFYLYLKDYLKDKIRSVADFYFKSYKNIDFLKIFDSISPKIRLYSLFHQDKETIYKYLISKTDKDLLLAPYTLKDKDEGYEIEVEASFADLYIDTLFINDGLKDKTISMIDLLDNNISNITRILHIVLDGFLYSYMKMEDNEAFYALAKKTFSKISTLIDYKIISDIEFTKSYLPLLEMIYLNDEDESIKVVVDTLVSNSLKSKEEDKEFYLNLLSIIPYLNVLHSSLINELIERYLTFSNYQEMIDFFLNMNFKMEEVEMAVGYCSILDN